MHFLSRKCLELRHLTVCVRVFFFILFQFVFVRSFSCFLIALLCFAQRHVYLERTTTNGWHSVILLNLFLCVILYFVSVLCFFLVFSCLLIAPLCSKECVPRGNTNDPFNDPVEKQT